MKKPSILLISSADPLTGAGRVALDYYKAFLKNGFNIEFLTLYPVCEYPEIRYVYTKPQKWRNRINRRIYKLTGCNKEKNGFRFFYTYEQLPEVPVNKVLKSVGKHYDLILVMFWQGMLSFKTIKYLYKQFLCQIHFMGVDYSQMTGGCHFPCDCLRYQVGCGMCPGVYSSTLKDFTYYNIRFRQKVYDMAKPVVYGNLYMREHFYAQSYLLKDARIEPSHDIYDMDEFKPMNRKKLREKYGIPGHKEFVVFFGCQNLNDERKGMRYLIDSLKLLWMNLNTQERESLQLVVAGHQFELIADSIPFDTMNLGFISMSQMPEIYAMADVFLSPSIYDAGPMMVNQSLACGTPVVAFDMGAAVESVKNQHTGYCAKLKDSADFAKGILWIFRLTEEEKENMRKKCREYAMNHFSYEARVRNIIDIFEKYNEK